jgi:hypothetical protein
MMAYFVHPMVCRVCLIGALSLLPVAVADAEEASGSAEASAEKKHEWGVGARVRRWRVDQRLQKLFFENTPGHAREEGGGIEFVRRKGELEIVLGFGYDSLQANDGFYVEKGGDPTMPGNVDRVEFHDFAWFTGEVTVVGHLELHKLLAFRYGVGLGVGLVRGEIRKTDAVCTSDTTLSSCADDPNAMTVNEPADVPPVLPVVNALVGLQLRPFEFLSVNVDAGLHTMPYVGASATLYLW